MKNTLDVIVVILVSLTMVIMGACNDSDAIEPCSSCFLVPEVGPCNAAIPKYYFDQEKKECKVFMWGGCNGVVPFETLMECQDCLCSD